LPVYIYLQRAKSTRSIMIRLNKIYLLFLTLGFSGISLFSQTEGAVGDAEAGKKLWVSSNCGSCHQVHKKTVGPALKGVQDRHSIDWIVEWVQNNEAMRKSGDAEALAIYEEYGGAAMNLFPNLTSQDVIDILAYIESVPDPKTAVASGPVAGGPAKEDNTTVFFLLSLVIIFAIIYFLLGKVKKSLIHSVMESEAGSSELASPKKGIAKHLPASWASMNPVILSLSVTTIIGLIGISFLYWFGMNKIGVQQGYAPVQPIAYSHALHAGELKIDCKYCHSTVETSKSASIPSLNTCMNCHKGVQASEKYAGETSPEIKKIYAALDYDPERPAGKEFGNNPKPIRWVRIHNLPDHAYFNHSQHVKVAGLECQQCHGPIEKMEVVQQWSTLQMAWCIDCHKSRGVDADNNNYYEALHAKAKADIETNGSQSKYKGPDGKVKITPAMNGGIECAKCHY